MTLRPLLPLLCLVIACGQAPAPEPIVILTPAEAPAPTPDPPATSGRLRVATWNIAWLDLPWYSIQAPRGPEDFELLSKYVALLDADVIGLQEIRGESAARTLFNGNWDVECEERQALQNVCLAVRRAAGWSITRHPDVVALGVTPNMRTGVDVTLTHPDHPALRVLTIHLKSGCFSGRGDPSCETLYAQIPALEAWIDARALEDTAFMILGDFNRRLSPQDDIWRDLDDSDPLNADLSRTVNADQAPCWGGRFEELIDHIVLDRRARPWLRDSEQLVFEEQDYDAFRLRLSDHCPLWADLEIPVVMETDTP